MTDVVGFAIINECDEVLIQRRDNMSNILFPDLWVIPGGTIKPGENPIDAVIREAKEEFAIDIIDEEVRFLGEYTRIEDNVHCLIFVTNRTGLLPFTVNEGAEARFVARRELTNFQFGFWQEKYLIPLLQR